MPDLYELTAWESHPEFDDHEIRKLGETIVLVLAPEGCDESQCWAWTDAPFISRRILGVPVGEAARIAQEAGLTFRIARQDGKAQKLHGDIRRDRITAIVIDGVVTEAEPA